MYEFKTFSIVAIGGENFFRTSILNANPLFTGWNLLLFTKLWRSKLFVAGSGEMSFVRTFINRLLHPRIFAGFYASVCVYLRFSFKKVWKRILMKLPTQSGCRSFDYPGFCSVQFSLRRFLFISWRKHSIIFCDLFWSYFSMTIHF